MLKLNKFNFHTIMRTYFGSMHSRGIDTSFPLDGGKSGKCSAVLGRNQDGKRKKNGGIGEKKRKG